MTKSSAMQSGSMPYHASPWIVGYSGLSIAFLWGLAEATFFFIIPDVFLSLAAILGGRRTWTHILAAIVGALLGGAILFQWALMNPPAAHAAVARVPFIRERMFSKVDDGFRKQGARSIAIGSVTGIPYKLFAVEAPRFISERTFLLASPFARGARFLAVWLLFAEISPWLRRRLDWSTSKLWCIHAIVWIASYAFYWGRIVLG